MGVPANDRLGLPTTYTINGKQWKFTRSTKAIKAAWSEWLCGRAEDAALELAAKHRKQARDKFAESKRIEMESIRGDDGDMPKDEVARLRALATDTAKEASELQQESVAVVDRFLDAKVSGDYAFGGNKGIDVGLRNWIGNQQFVYLCLKPNHPSLTIEELAEEWVGTAEDGTRIGDLWMQALNDSENSTTSKNDESPAPDTKKPTATN